MISMQYRHCLLIDSSTLDKMVSSSHLKHNFADPSSMQDTCHMNFVIDLAHCRVSVA